MDDKKTANKILELFCDTDVWTGERDGMCYIEREDVSISTDRYKLVAINGKHTDRQDFSEAKENYVLSYLKADVSDARSYSLKQLQTVLGRVPLVSVPTMVKCEHCDGWGEVEYEHHYNKSRHTVDEICPACNGAPEVESGRVAAELVPDKAYKFIIDSCIMPVPHLGAIVETMKLLGTDTAQIVAVNNAGPLLVRTGDCFMLFVVQRARYGRVYNDNYIEIN